METKSADNILVAIDFGPCSRAELVYALSRTKARGGRVHVLHAYEPPYYAPEALITLPGQPPMPLQEYADRDAAMRMSRFLEETPEWLESRAERRPELTFQLVGGIADDEICRAATVRESTLIIMGTHGRKGLSHLLLGSVAERVIRRSPCPVLVIHERDLPQRATTVARPTKVLVPIDFGTDASSPARLALEFEGPTPFELHLLHVVATPAYAGDVIVPRAGGVTLGHYLHESAEANLRAFAETLVPKPAKLHVTRGSPADCIVHIAAEEDIDLLVMGTHGRTGLAHFFLGSVTERVLPRVTCPVLVTRAP
ncbi:MAG: universal stress protein [Myxococcales bacterium]|nr:universal stress protein [Myxococcales bacterium]